MAPAEFVCAWSCWVPRPKSKGGSAWRWPEAMARTGLASSSPPPRTSNRVGPGPPRAGTSGSGDVLVLGRGPAQGAELGWPARGSRRLSPDARITWALPAPGARMRAAIPPSREPSSACRQRRAEARPARWAQPPARRTGRCARARMREPLRGQASGLGWARAHPMNYAALGLAAQCRSMNCSWVGMAWTQAAITSRTVSTCFCTASSSCASTRA
jgi:hypothetical protein